MWTKTLYKIDYILFYYVFILEIVLKKKKKNYYYEGSKIQTDQWIVKLMDRLATCYVKNV